jgi:hypothetical protein
MVGSGTSGFLADEQDKGPSEALSQRQGGMGVGEGPPSGCLGSRKNARCGHKSYLQQHQGETTEDLDKTGTGWVLPEIT